MNLMRLKIPAGWQVMKNSFFDVEGVEHDGSLKPRSVFVQDILSLQYGVPRKDATEDKGYVVDLGWYPDQDPNGQYRLVLLKEDWDDVLSTYESRDRLRVREELEIWLDAVARATDRAQLERFLSKQTRRRVSESFF